MSEKELLLNMYGDLCKDFAKLDEYFKEFFNKSYCKTLEEYIKKRRNADIYVYTNVRTLQKKFYDEYCEKVNAGYLFDVFNALHDSYETRYGNIISMLDYRYGYNNPIDGCN